MKKFKKVLVMSLATMTAVSAISVSAMAKENDYIAWFYNENNDIEYVTEADIEAGNNVFDIGNGETIEVKLGETVYSGINQFSVDGTNFSATTPPTLNSDLYALTSEYDGIPAIPAYSKRYSNKRLTNGIKSNLAMDVTPSGSTSDLTGLKVNLYRIDLSDESSDLIGGISPKRTTVTLNVYSLSPMNQFYTELNNTSSSRLNAYVCVSAY